MLQIPCPWCGPRQETEFSYGGQAHVARPKDTESLSDEEWGAYLYIRENPRGIYLEQWCHRAGCRRWFNAARDTVSNRILQVYRVGEPKPRGEN